MNMRIEVDGYYEQVLLSVESCTLQELRQIYRLVKKQASSHADMPRLLVSQYGYTRLPYDASVKVAFVIDTDTDRIYAPTY